MGKPTKVLIGDNSVELGMAFSKYLRNMGVDTLCRRNDINLLYNEIAAEKPDFAILTIAAPDSRTVGLIGRIKSDFPETKVIAVSYISSQKLCREAVLNGAERCIVMPVSMNELYSAISESEASAGIFKFDPAVYEYLSSVRNTVSYQRIPLSGNCCMLMRYESRLYVGHYGRALQKNCGDLRCVSGSGRTFTQARFGHNVLKRN